LSTRTTDVHSIMCYHIRHSILKKEYQDQHISGGEDITDIDWKLARALYPRPSNIPYKILDHTGEAADIVVSSSGYLSLYQCRKDGSVWSYGGPAQWLPIDILGSAVELLLRNNAHLYQRRDDGHVLMYDKKSHHWDTLDRNRLTTQLAATKNNLYQLRSNGQVLKYLESSDEWTRVDKKPTFKQLVATEKSLFGLTTLGNIWMYRDEHHDWKKVHSADGGSTMDIAASRDRLYRVDGRGHIFMWSDVSDGFKEIHGRSKTSKLFTDANTVYRQDSSGPIYVHSTDGWKQFYTVQNSRKFASYKDDVYMLSGTGQVLAYED